jgi:competence protein ComEC
MSPSKILFYLCLSFIFGIAIESAIKIPQAFLVAFLFLSILIIFGSFFIKKGSLTAGFCLLVIILGILRVQISEFVIANDKLSKLNDQGKITFEGTIIAEPDVRDKYQRLKVKTNDSVVLVTANRYPEYNYLDQIKLAGKLETSQETPDFNYKNYLMKDGIYSVMAFPKTELISKEHKYNVFTFVYEKILFLKQKIRESIRDNFSPPQSLILEGTILGDNGSLTNELKTQLNITGLRHIIAVSGTHIVIFSSIIMSLLLFIGMWRTRAFYLNVVFIWVYIILTGLPASAVRAGVMGTLFLLAQKLGRQSGGDRVVIMAATTILFFNPLLLFYDVGFQLSFLAVLGLVYLEPFIKNSLASLVKKVKKIKEENQGKVLEIITMISATLAAQIFTLPIMIYNFGNMSLVAPITNILILPIVSWLMIFGFLSSFIGVFSSFLGWVFSLPSWVLLTYFVKVIEFFSQPWAMKTFENVHFVWLIILYFIIGSSTWLINKKYTQKFP